MSLSLVCVLARSYWLMPADVQPYRKQSYRSTMGGDTTALHHRKSDPVSPKTFSPYAGLGVFHWLFYLFIFAGFARLSLPFTPCTHERLLPFPHQVFPGRSAGRALRRSSGEGKLQTPAVSDAAVNPDSAG